MCNWKTMRCTTIVLTRPTRPIASPSCSRACAMPVCRPRWATRCRPIVRRHAAYARPQTRHSHAAAWWTRATLAHARRWACSQPQPLPVRVRQLWRDPIAKDVNEIQDILSILSVWSNKIICFCRKRVQFYAVSEWRHLYIGERRRHPLHVRLSIGLLGPQLHGVHLAVQHDQLRQWSHLLCQFGHQSALLCVRGRLQWSPMPEL